MAKPITKPEKVRIVSNFILHSPPGEFNEVFNDVRTLLQDDELLKEEGSGAAAQYNKEQFIQCKIEGSEEQVLITEHGDVGGGRFYDPRTKQTFRYDHLRKEASDLKPGKTDKVAETWRAPFETAFTTYVKNYFSKGVTSVYGNSADGTITLITCTESHQFNAKNFWSVAPVRSFQEEVHYYEEGNVQLVTTKEVKETLAITSPEDTAKAFCHLVQTAETDYQTAITENYQTMSSTTFKALRRALPITKAKIDWGKIAGFGIGKELKKTA